ncbi:MAG: arylesterase [SAR324 cluster bacterium]|uniref:Arylesterase n=1 Tax=SAR324 cluster bacterium TaxID=2024889 RepID=A0A2A4TC87_9DELT|nr:MAG: arylesterase [SAR324 cluster bacterium]
MKQSRRFHPPKLLFLLGILFLLNPFQLYGATKTTLLMLGDSLTAGYGVDKEQAFPFLLQKKFEMEGYQITVINGGISGSTSASALGRLKWYSRIQPNLLFLELGANDGLRGLSVESMKKNLGKAIQFAQAKGMRVILAGMKMPLNYGDTYTKQFETAFHELAEQYKIPIIPFLLEGVAGNPQLNLADGIHPTTEGHRIISQTIFKHLQPLVKK